MKEYKMYQYPRGVNMGGGTKHRILPYYIHIILAEQLLSN